MTTFVVPRLMLKSKEDRRLLRGHLWAYRNEFEALPELEDGDVVDVFSAEKRLIGRGFYQVEGGIAVRMLDRNPSEVSGEAFLRGRIMDALEMRHRFYPGCDTYRWVYGESDYLPGLVADRFGAVVSVKTSCVFYRQHAETLAKIFLEQDGVSCVSLDFRQEALLWGEMPETQEVEFNGVRLSFSLKQGQKTGLFLDQRENTRLLDAVAKGKRVFDGHCYVGQWACRALKAGAASVLAVDTSAPALEWARKNAALNGNIEGDDAVCKFECASVENVLKRGDKYDVVCIDPPGLAKTRGMAAKALELYGVLNREAFKSVVPGGYVISSSCSQPVGMDDFVEMLKRAARSAQRSVRILSQHGAPVDHPVLLEMPETHYLKCVMMQVR
ncbi:TPA: hypothetical protein DDW35_08250 [Candidatus Sumerlaeota bacterium]|jgi:23S rRNA (cytosine1962-C5)-methyltransferase|nr:hypothetical protein [Candidatus Sumerlaeota bacterium]